MFRLTRARRPVPQEPAPVRANRIRTRLDALDTERLELLADERVPGRKHRLDALAAARHDLVTELDALAFA